MEFFLTLAVLAVVAGLLSAAIVFGVLRATHRSGTAIAVLVGLILFAVFAFGGLWVLIYDSARRGHPF